MLVAAVENIVPGSFLSALSLKGIHPGCLSFYCRCPISLVVKKHRCHTETMATTSERAKKKNMRLPPQIFLSASSCQNRAVICLCFDPSSSKTPILTLKGSGQTLSFHRRCDGDAALCPSGRTVWIAKAIVPELRLSPREYLSFTTLTTASFQLERHRGPVVPC